MLAGVLPICAIILALLLPRSAPAAPAPPGLLSEAQACEQKGDWIGSCRKYDEVIRRERDNLEARDGYHRCLRQYQIVRRHSDPVYRDALTHLTPADALDIYESVLAEIPKYYVERDKTELNALVKHGVQEVRYAFNQSVFVREHLKDADPAAVEAFKSELAAWPDRKINKSADARNMILALADLAAQDKLVQDRSSFVVVLAFEFAFGACAGLDEYTLFLTPQHYGTKIG